MSNHTNSKFLHEKVRVCRYFLKFRGLSIFDSIFDSCVQLDLRGKNHPNRFLESQVINEKATIMIYIGKNA